MSYIIKSMSEGKPYYFYKLCRRVYQNLKTPAFYEDIDHAYIFDTKERAYRMMSIIANRYPSIHLELEEIEDHHSLRGPDGYVPLENTVDAMLSDFPDRRLWAEYEQLNTRHHRLKEYRKGLDENLTNPAKLSEIDEQLANMHGYMVSLLMRCDHEGIDLDEVEKKEAMRRGE